jgi:hypothetical protein
MIVSDFLESRLISEITLSQQSKLLLLRVRGAVPLWLLREAGWPPLQDRKSGVLKGGGKE